MTVIAAADCLCETYTRLSRPHWVMEGRGAEEASLFLRIYRKLMAAVRRKNIFFSDLAIGKMFL